MKKQDMKKSEVNIRDKILWTPEEASQMTGIGINKIRELSNGRDCPFVLWVGNRRLIKRVKLDEYLSKLYSV